MQCQVCRRGTTSPGHATVVLQRGETTVVLKQVPAEVCDDCSEYYLSEDISSRVLARAEEAVRNGTELEIVRFAA